MTRDPLVLCTRVLAILVALAGTRVAAETQRDAARKHFAEGKKAQDAGDFDRAIAEYQAANELAPAPANLFNIGQCYRLKGDKPSALKAYKAYLAAMPNGRGATDASEFVKELERAITEDAARAAPPPPPEPAPPPPVVAPVVPPLVPAPSPASEPEPSHPRRTLRIAGLATAGGGVLLLAGGTYFGLHARSIAGDVDALSDRWDQDLYESGQRARTLSYVLVGTGAAAVLAGGILYYLGVRSAATEHVTVVPAAGGAAMRVRF